MTAAPSARFQPNLSIAVTGLMKGVVHRDAQPVVWQHLLALRPQVHDYVAVLGLVAVVDEAEGYAFLRSRPDSDDDSEVEIPRLVARRALSFPVSLLLALLRKKLAEADAGGDDGRLVLSRDQIVEMLMLFLPPAATEARLVDQIDTHIGKVVDLGFLRKVGGQPPEFEVRRILKAFVDAQWLADFDARLAEYARSVGVVAPDGGDA